MRIALISSSYDPYPGGVEEHTRRVARVLADRGHDVVVWTVDRGERLGVREVDGLTVRYLPTPLPARSAGALARAALAVPRAFGAWLTAYRRDRPEVLNVQCFGPNGLYAMALGRVVRRPVVLSSHGETFMDDHAVFESSALLRAALRRSLREARAVTGCSTLVLDDLRSRFGLVGGSVVPNGVDLAEPGEPAAQGAVDSSAERPVIAALGRVEHVKGFDLLLEAVAGADLARRATVVIGGDGGALADLRARAGALGISDRVEFPGRLDRRAVVNLLSRADVLVVPSRREAFGIVFLEGWRAGAPLVVTSLGGPGTIVRDGIDGLVVDPTDAAALGDALRRILDDPELGRRLAAAGLERVTDFTWSKTVDEYERVYASVTA